MSYTGPYRARGNVRSTNAIRTVAGAIHAKSKRTLAVSLLDATSSMCVTTLPAGWIIGLLGLARCYTPGRSCPTKVVRHARQLPFTYLHPTWVVSMRFSRP
jgi:hypothetical protein